MIPVVFSGCRGWYHTATGTVSPRPGLVFFPAFGVEDLSTRHSLLCLASRLADAGHPVLRFDLPGTGDALGESGEVSSLEQWIVAGRAAIGTLRNLSGQTQIALLGLRLGGLIASLVAEAEAADCRPAAGLALLAPTLDGRRYLRELRTLALPGTPLTVAGFPLSDTLCAEIGNISPSRFSKAPTPAIFLGLPGAAGSLETLIEEWQHQIRITREPYDDLSGHIGNPTLSRAPETLFAALSEWCRHLPDGPSPGQPAIPDAPLLVTPDYREISELFAIENGMAGVWCLPANEAAETPFVIFCNAGRNPHHGWARSSVSMARQLAARGFASLRFDLPGLGDSLPMQTASGEILYSDTAIPFLRAMIDVIETRHGSTTPLCVVGSCSGAHQAFHEAVDDPRVAGLVMINLQRFVWEPGTSLVATMRSSGRSTQAYRQRALSATTWKRLLSGQIDIPAVARPLLMRGTRAMAAQPMRLARAGLQLLGRKTNSPQATIPQKMAGIAQRGTKIVLIFSEEDGGRDEFARHFGETGRRFNMLPNTRLVILPDADHDLTPLAARHRLFEEILSCCHSVRDGISGADAEVAG